MYYTTPEKKQYRVLESSGSFYVQRKYPIYKRINWWSSKKEIVDYEWRICDKYGKAAYFCYIGGQKFESEAIVFDTLNEAKNYAKRFTKNCIIHEI